MIKSICVIDDDEIYQFTMRKAIRALSEEIELIEFDRTENALAYFTAYKDEPHKLPEMVFLDIHMPTMGGWQLLDELKQLLGEDNKQGIIIYITSSSIDLEDEAKAKGHPLIKDFLMKPVSMRMLNDLLLSNISDAMSKM